jgi:hypothetical protein
LRAFGLDWRMTDIMSSAVFLARLHAVLSASAAEVAGRKMIRRQRISFRMGKW